MRRFPRARACPGAGAWTEGSLRGSPSHAFNTGPRWPCPAGLGRAESEPSKIPLVPHVDWWVRFVGTLPWVSVDSLSLTGCFLSLKSGDTDA